MEYMFLSNVLTHGMDNTYRKTYTPQADSMLIECRPLDYFCLQGVINLRY